MSILVDSGLVTVRTFCSETEAMVAKAALISFGIDCATAADDCGHLRPSLTMANGIRLLVRPEDVSQAADVLSNVAQDPIQDPT